MRLPSVPRATGLGAAAGAAALLLWMAMLSWPRAFVIPHVVALAITAACGAYVLLSTWYDSIHHPRRGVRIRPIRGFDVAAGLVLLVPAGWALAPYLPAL